MTEKWRHPRSGARNITRRRRMLGPVSILLLSLKGCVSSSFCESFSIISAKQRKGICSQHSFNLHFRTKKWTAKIKTRSIITFLQDTTYILGWLRIVYKKTLTASQWKEWEYPWKRSCDCSHKSYAQCLFVPKKEGGGGEKKPVW